MKEFKEIHIYVLQYNMLLLNFSSYVHQITKWNLRSFVVHFTSIVWFKSQSYGFTDLINLVLFHILGELMGALCAKYGPDVYVTVKDKVLEGVRCNLERQPLAEADQEEQRKTEQLVEKLAGSQRERVMENWKYLVYFWHAAHILYFLAAAEHLN